ENPRFDMLFDHRFALGGSMNVAPFAGFARTEDCCAARRRKTEPGDSVEIPVSGELRELR
ncbi:MAG TPA: hypothetical protein VG246_00445, partial [Acidimicrobiales bacterium]|nr:hypothetical protein [Acidimicrobiales bacterium]